MSAPPRGARVRFVALDGRTLGGVWWAGARARQQSVVVLPGLAIPQVFYRWFATHLAAKGWGVLTFDYRGVGGSRVSTADEGVTADDWIELDLPAAVEEARRRSGGGGFVGVVAHSVGGQLLGQSTARSAVDGALLVAAQRGIPRLFTGVSRLRVLYAYLTFPLLIRLLGRLPVSRWTLPTPCPAQVLLQWIGWGRRGVFTDRRGGETEGRFAELRAPLTAVRIADDDRYAPAAAVEALTRLYSGTAVRREVLVPAEYGLPAIGHFGVFERRVPPTLWDRLEGWLAALREDPDGAARRGGVR